MNNLFYERKFNPNPGYHPQPHLHPQSNQNSIYIKQSSGIPFVAGMVTGALLTPQVSPMPYQPYPPMAYPQYPPYPPTPYPQPYPNYPYYQ